MTTERVPGTFSAAVKPRPSAGWTPRIWKSSAEMDLRLQFFGIAVAGHGDAVT